jgi:hypothetical protein
MHLLNGNFNSSFSSIKYKQILNSKIIYTLIIIVFFDQFNSHIINSSRSNWKSYQDEKPYHECVHDKKIKEIVGENIMIHQPLDQEESDINHSHAIESDEGELIVNQLTKFFLTLIYIRFIIRNKFIKTIIR